MARALATFSPEPGAGFAPSSNTPITARAAPGFLPTVTDDFTGSAPDLGALEVGKPMPRYGPRR
ncbi:MAG: hypothetical protein EHM89_13235 [Acidobacteria bacterium]|nr:MAG: hypothetical protein EHM89_13235 [Acidobacteriota bacterium]